MEFQKERVRRGVCIGCGAVSVLLIALGILQGEPALVLEKAIRICLECIGIG